MSELALAFLLLLNPSAKTVLDPALLGPWLGSLQFVAPRLNGVVEHTFASVSFTVNPDRTVSGRSADTGCSFAGTLAPQPRVRGAAASLSLTATRCKNAGFNGSYVGEVTRAGGARIMELALKGVEAKQRHGLVAALRPMGSVPEVVASQ